MLLIGNNGKKRGESKEKRKKEVLSLLMKTLR